MPDTPVEDRLCPDPLFARPCGWLLRDGRFYSCPYFGHQQLSARIWQDVFGKDHPNPEHEAEVAGWIKLTIDGMPVVFRHPTEAQRDAVRAWCFAFRQDPKEIEMLREEN